MIVIDPGHGGADPGCELLWLVEKDLTLHLALLMGKFAGISGLPARLTRDSDETLSLAMRARRAKACGAEEILCLHFDTNPNPGVGRLTCYCDAKDQRSQGLAAHVIRAAPPALTEGSRIIFIEPTGWKRRAYNVVRAYNAPTLLVECAFISFPQHREFLRAPLSLPTLAAGLMAALLVRHAVSGPIAGTTSSNAPLDHSTGLGSFTAQKDGV